METVPDDTLVDLLIDADGESIVAVVPIGTPEYTGLSSIGPMRLNDALRHVKEVAGLENHSAREYLESVSDALEAQISTYCSCYECRGWGQTYPEYMDDTDASVSIVTP